MVVGQGAEGGGGIQGTPGAISSSNRCVLGAAVHLVGGEDKRVHTAL